MRKLLNEELNRISVEDFKNKKKIPLVIVLDNVRSMNNVGSAFRTADAFCVESIHLCGITARPPHREINKTALGATESVSWTYHEKTTDAVELLKSQGFRIVSIEQVEGAQTLQNFNPVVEEKYACIFGNEAFGVEPEVVDQSDLCLEIPQHGTKHSINISVCIGIVVWDYVSKTKQV
jgi:tRNA G18 (ribose-2'-O)-methylase SpoU